MSVAVSLLGNGQPGRQSRPWIRSVTIGAAAPQFYHGPTHSVQRVPEEGQRFIWAAAWPCTGVQIMLSERAGDSQAWSPPEPARLASASKVWRAAERPSLLWGHPRDMWVPCAQQPSFLRVVPEPKPLPRNAPDLGEDQLLSDVYHPWGGDAIGIRQGLHRDPVSPGDRIQGIARENRVDASRSRR